MPLYEYQCESCGTVFEVRQKFSDEPLKLHEACGGPVHRILSAPALQFKGSGWYVTDYGRSSGPRPSNGGQNSSDNKSEGKSDNKSEGKSEGKSSETKSEAKPAAAGDSKKG